MLTAPLRYGEPLALVLKWAAPSNVTQPATLRKDSRGEFLSFPVDKMAPRIMPDALANPAVRLESLDGRRMGSTILAGDRVRVGLCSSGSYAGKGSPGNPDSTYPWVINVAAAGAFTILHSGDDPISPSRLGEYFLEDDKVNFVIGEIGAQPKGYIIVELSSRYLHWIEGFRTGADFSLKRCDEHPEA